MVALATANAGTMRVAITDSVFANSPSGNGIDCNTTVATMLICSVRNSTIANNGNVALNAGGAANLVVTRSTITGNAHSWSGSVYSFVDNDIDFNLDSNPPPPDLVHQ